MVNNKNIVWKFTNQRELTKGQFLDYFEKKIFRTIRQYDMLKDKDGRRIKIKKEASLNFIVLKSILEKKFEVIVVNSSRGFDICSDNLSDVAESAFENVLDGIFNLKKLKPKNQPLYFLSDAEVLLYSKLSGLKGRMKKRNAHVQKLFVTFMKKNPDLEHNIVNAMRQLE
ncbi:MAG: hypothetical protein WCP89_01155 [archaeon]